MVILLMIITLIHMYSKDNSNLKLIRKQDITEMLVKNYHLKVNQSWLVMDYDLEVKCSRVYRHLSKYNQKLKFGRNFSSGSILIHQMQFHLQQFHMDRDILKFSLKKYQNLYSDLQLCIAFFKSQIDIDQELISF